MTIEETLKNYLIQECAENGAPAAAIDVETDLFKQGLIDSLGILRLVSFIEEEFDILVPEEKLRPENFASIRSLTALVKEIRAA